MATEKYDPVMVRLEPEQLESLERVVAQKQGRSRTRFTRSDAIRAAIDRWIAENDRA